MNMEMAVENTQLVAVTPTELIPAQAQVIDWCRSKILALSSELREQRDNLRQARAMHWKRTGWQSAINRTKKRMIYYAKLKAAATAGYLIVPNFNVDVIAVRVNRHAPKIESTSVNHPSAEPDMSPHGRGRYVDDKAITRDDSYSEKDQQGKLRTIERYTTTGYGSDIDFPVSLVKPEILAQTDRAMALRIFDRIGVVRGGRRSDPIVVGQIVDPREKYWHHNPRCISFFIAWWLDTRDL